MDKEDALYIYVTEYYSARKNGETLPFAERWMDFYSKWSKSDKERQILYDSIYMWNQTSE